MKNHLTQKVLPVAFWSHNGRLWIEFSDGRTQGFQAAQMGLAKVSCADLPRKPSKHRIITDKGGDG